MENKENEPWFGVRLEKDSVSRVGGLVSVPGVPGIGEKESGWRQAGAQAGVSLPGAVPRGDYFCFFSSAKSQLLTFIAAKRMCWEAQGWWPLPPPRIFMVGRE